MISVEELLQVAVAVSATVLTSVALRRWGSRHHNAARPAESKRTQKQATRPVPAAERTAKPAPAQQAEKPVAPAAKKSVESELRAEAANPAPQAAANAAAPRESQQKAVEDEPPCSPDSILDDVLDTEANADALLDELLNGEAASGSTSKPHSDSETAGARRMNGDDAMPGRDTDAPAAAAEPAQKPVAEEPDEDALLDAVLDEVGAANDLLDECLDAAAAAEPTKPADARPDAVLPSTTVSSTAAAAGPSPTGSSSFQQECSTAAAYVAEQPGAEQAEQRSRNRGEMSHKQQHQPHKQRPEERPELVVSGLVRDTPRPQPDPQRAEMLLRTGRELLMLHQPQAALDALCAAHRYADFESDPGMRRRVHAAMREAFEQADALPRFTADVEPWL